jgi:integrase
LVERLVWVQKVASSNLVTLTVQKSAADRYLTHLPYVGQSSLKRLTKTEASVFGVKGARPMPRLKENQIPSYRLHKQSGQAIVTLDGRDHLLGTYNSAASKRAYQRLTAEWLANRGVPREAASDLTLNELVLAFWKHAKTHYRKADGSETSELYLYKMALKVMRVLYGDTRAADFGPRCLKAVMQEMVGRGWCRKSINKHTARIKHLFRWAVSNELVPPSLHHGLLAVSGLPKGRTDAKESDPVKPVPEAHVHAVLPHVSRQVKSMVELQLLTGMRPGEACAMRGCDIDTTGKLWLYKPAQHKNEHRDHERVIYLGPQAKAIVEQFWKPNLQAHLFSPADAVAEMREARRQSRKTPLDQGNAPGTNCQRCPKREAQDQYSVDSYRRAIERGCEVAFGMPDDLHEPRGKKAKKAETDLEPDVQMQRRIQRRKGRAAWRAQHCWGPHQLRHTAATNLRKEYGLEAAQVILGHKTLTVTQIYAEKNVEAAQRIMAEVG